MEYKIPLDRFRNASRYLVEFEYPGHGSPGRENSLTSDFADCLFKSSWARLSLVPSIIPIWPGDFP